jgi:hypothetical protein
MRCFVLLAREQIVSDHHQLRQLVVDLQESEVPRKGRDARRIRIVVAPDEVDGNGFVLTRLDDQSGGERRTEITAIDQRAHSSIVFLRAQPVQGRLQGPDVIVDIGKDCDFHRQSPPALAGGCVRPPFRSLF